MSAQRDSAANRKWSAEDVVGEAERRWLHDAEFHAEVYQAVSVAFSQAWPNPLGPVSRGDCLHAAAVALAIRDVASGSTPSEDTP